MQKQKKARKKSKRQTDKTDSIAKKVPNQEIMHESMLGTY